MTVLTGFKLNDFPNAIASVANGNADLKSLSITSDALITDAFNQIKGGTNLPIKAFETHFIGNCVPSWIAPLNFNHNLINAVECLEQLEAIINAYQELQLIELTATYYRHSADESGRDELDQIASAMSLEEKNSQLQVRYIQKFIELFTYSLAAKFGAQYLYDIVLDKVSADSKEDPIAVIREQLRLLLQENQRLSQSLLRTTVAVSLKQSKVNGGEYLVGDEYWKGSQGLRHPTSTLINSVIEFDLGGLPIFNRLNKPRVNGIGIEVITEYGTHVNPHNNSNDWKPGEIFEFEMTSMDGIDLNPDNNSSTVLKLPTMHVGAIGGGKVGRKIGWLEDQQLLNINPNRKWKLEYLKDAGHHADTNHIWDIILHFDVTYRGE